MCAMTGNSISLESKRPGLNRKKNLAFYVMTNTVKDNFYTLGLTGDWQLLIRAAKPNAQASTDEFIISVFGSWSLPGAPSSHHYMGSMKIYL